MFGRDASTTLSRVEAASGWPVVADRGGTVRVTAPANATSADTAAELRALRQAVPPRLLKREPAVLLCTNEGDSQQIPLGDLTGVVRLTSHHREAWSVRVKSGTGHRKEPLVIDDRPVSATNVWVRACILESVPDDEFRGVLAALLDGDGSFGDAVGAALSLTPGRGEAQPPWVTDVLQAP